jgi:predicted nucleic-acid-binding protein
MAAQCCALLHGVVAQRIEFGHRHVFGTQVPQQQRRQQADGTTTDDQDRLGLQAGDKTAWSMLSNGTIVLRPKTRRLVADATAAGEPLLVSLCALLETEWVLRCRYKVNRKAMASAFISMLEAPGIEFEHDATVEEALYLLDQHPAADFADCLLVARASHLGRSRFVTFDAGAARLPRAELLR